MTVDFQRAEGPHGALADLMTVLSHEIFETDWLGGLEHHLWRLYLEALRVRPGEQTTGYRVMLFGGLATSLDGLWTWPLHIDCPTWTSLDEFLEQHRRWQDRRR